MYTVDSPIVEVVRVSEGIQRLTSTTRCPSTHLHNLFAILFFFTKCSSLSLSPASLLSSLALTLSLPLQSEVNAVAKAIPVARSVMLASLVYSNTNGTKIISKLQSRCGPLLTHYSQVLTMFEVYRRWHDDSDDDSLDQNHHRFQQRYDFRTYRVQGARKAILWHRRGPRHPLRLSGL